MTEDVSSIDVSVDASEQAWDAFIAAHPDGHYMQSSAWGEFKTAFAWRVARVTIARDGEIVAGTQILLRSLPLLGAVGWAPRAPVIARDATGDPDPELAARMLEALGRFARSQRVQLLMIQPPSGNESLLEALIARGYRRTVLTMAPTATVLVDLRPDEDALLAAMRKKTRQHVRKGLREGVSVREGGQADLGAFYGLHVATSERQGFTPYPEDYFSRLWRVLGPSGGIRLLLAELDGELVSALLLVAFGDTAYTLAVGWSGRSGRCMPNEVLYWSALTWAKRHGYRWCDLVYIDPRAGAALTEGSPLPPELRESATFFKLGLGGEVTVLPRAYEYIYNPVLRAIYGTVVPWLFRMRRVRRALITLRWRWLPSRRAGRTAGS